MSITGRGSVRGKADNSNTVHGKAGISNAIHGKAGIGNVIYGKDGVIFTPAVDEEGNLSWTNDGGLENPVTVNVKGPKGDKGDRGDRGVQGPQGDPGHTPVKGVDYYTDTDKTELVNAVLAALPDASNVSF